eukprot:TRINITY_DN2431_c1_g1_i1.p1 TRINITY_DN2431_c1_g1~~TRINITY_DN2431_c1_g1_i1.p1  ORF type:complete len:242 (-),score=36.81 TRINITY_DN2431_c1_g1_i1:43-768(-)
MAVVLPEGEDLNEWLAVNTVGSTIRMNRVKRKFFDKNKTFKPKKNYEKGTARYDLHRKAKETYSSGNLRMAVVLPEGEDLNEWLAVNTVDFYNQINLIFGSISTFCTAEICPIMSAGSRFEYLWADPGSKVRPQPVPAIQYIDNVLNWVKNLLEDEEIFPSSYEDSFPSNFAKIIKNVYKKLFRIYAHIYYSHFEQIMQSGEEAHLNTCFKHFYFFIREFRLVDDREMAPLAELIQNIGDR